LLSSPIFSGPPPLCISQSPAYGPILLLGFLTHTMAGSLRRVAFLSARELRLVQLGTVLVLPRSCRNLARRGRLAGWRCGTLPPVPFLVRHPTLLPVVHLLLSFRCVLVWRSPRSSLSAVSVPRKAFLHHAGHLPTLRIIFLTRILAWFAVLYLVAGTVSPVEHGHDGASGSTLARVGPNSSAQYTPHRCPSSLHYAKPSAGKRDP